MKKIVGILGVLLLCGILVMPVSAEVPTMTVTPARVVNPGTIVDFIITFSPYTPGWVAIEDVHMWWDLYVYSTEPYFVYIEGECLNSETWGYGQAFCEIADHYQNGINYLTVFNNRRESTGPLSEKIHTIMQFFAVFNDYTDPNNPIEQTKSVTVQVSEFPSPFLPATAIIGFLGAVLIIQRARKN